MSKHTHIHTHTHTHTHTEAALASSEANLIFLAVCNFIHRTGSSPSTWRDHVTGIWISLSLASNCERRVYIRRAITGNYVTSDGRPAYDEHVTDSQRTRSRDRRYSGRHLISGSTLKVVISHNFLLLSPNTGFIRESIRELFAVDKRGRCGGGCGWYWSTAWLWAIISDTPEGHTLSLWLCVWLCVCVWVYLSVCVCVCIYAFLYDHVHLCVRACVCVCVCDFLCVRVFVRYAYMHVFVCVYTHICMCTFPCMCIFLCVFLCMHTYL